MHQTDIFVAMTIAGSDSGGGAGIQADLKTFAALDCFGTSAITAITAQNTTGVKAASLLDPELIRQQIEAVANDMPIAACKTGMLGSAAIIQTVADAIREHNICPVVVDPVMVAKSGDPLIDDDAVATLADQLLPLAAVVTPNHREAAKLLDLPEPIRNEAQGQNAAREICKRFGVSACVVKGFRRVTDDGAFSVDIFFDGQKIRELTTPWHDTTHTHGSGCTFSAATTAALARGHTLAEALDIAKRFIFLAIEDELELGHGVHPVNHLAWLKR